MNKKITIVISSRDEENEELIKNINETICVDCSIMFIQNNGISLTKVYQDALEKSETDIVVFMHDDIKFLKIDWGKELIRMFNEHKEFGIIGVAGSSEFYKEGMWWINEKIYGQVMHEQNGNVWLTSFSSLLKKDLEEVCVIDGLFMAVHKQRITKGFDKSIDGFHFYDIDFCLSNFLDKKTKIGVTTNIRLMHKSVGALSDGWLENREIINNKYKNYLPIKL